MHITRTPGGHVDGALEVNGAFPGSPYIVDVSDSFHTFRAVGEFVVRSLPFLFARHHHLFHQDGTAVNVATPISVIPNAHHMTEHVR